MPVDVAGETKVPLKPRRPGRLHGASAFLALSLLFHLCYIGSIFDIYFKSPVTKGVTRRFAVAKEGARFDAEAEVEALAKRVVLLVGDGLRADKLFQTYDNPPFAVAQPLPDIIMDIQHASIHGMEGRTTPAPFIRGLIDSGKAEWGVSHTRVPTESRPGHVALIGGMYEDVSAVTRGWTTNPVAFDSVFNQSSHTYSFGSPDILPMFKQGASDPNRIDAWSYGEEYEDFSSDAVHLDLWCLDQLRTLFQNSSGDAKLTRQLHQPGTVFFLHLLGLDTTGHSYRPHGPEYHRNIRVVDHVVEQTTLLMEQFYGDDDTAYVFTADHGMSSKGNHGDGEPDNTRTPLVAWGAGIGGKDSGTPHDKYSESWGLAGHRRDVEQADVADLMSVLGGLPIPANSAGKVPLGYLNASPSFKARAAYANALQTLAEFEMKSKLAASSGSGTTSATIDDHKDFVEALISSGQFEKAQQKSMELVETGLRGLHYFQTYDWFILRSIVALGYLGFIAYSSSFVLRKYVYVETNPTSDLSVSAMITGATIFIALAVRFFLERSPPSYYVYSAFPCFFWSSVLRSASSFKGLWHGVTAISTSPRLVGLACLLLSLQAMVWGYAHRQVFSVLLLAMGAVWPVCYIDRAIVRANSGTVVAWTSSCITLAVFPLLPVEKGESIVIIMAGGVTFVNLALLAIRSLETDNAVRKAKSPGAKQGSLTLSNARRAIQYQMVLTLACMVVTASSARSLQLKKGLPSINQSLGWIILIQSIAVPLIHGRPAAQPFMERLFVILFTFAPSFIILSLSYEALFFATLCVALLSWMKLEIAVASNQRTETQEPGINADHLRISLFFLAFVHICFFGVGNVASISSFYLEPVYRLIPVFAPFPMAALLLFKLLTPFVALSVVTSALSHQLRLPPFSLFIIASILSDYLALAFFFRVTTVGSWLEIGSSITNFVICSMLGIFNTALYLLGEEFLRSVV